MMMINRISPSFLAVPKAKVEYNNRNFTLGVIPRFGADGFNFRGYDFKKSENLSYEADKILQLLVKNESPTAIKIQQNLSVHDPKELGNVLKDLFDKGYIDVKFTPILQKKETGKSLSLEAFKNDKEMQKNFWSDHSNYFSTWMKDSTKYNITVEGAKYLLKSESLSDGDLKIYLKHLPKLLSYAKKMASYRYDPSGYNKYGLNGIRDILPNLIDMDYVSLTSQYKNLENMTNSDVAAPASLGIGFFGMFAVWSVLADDKFRWYFESNGNCNHPIIFWLCSLAPGMISYIVFKSIALIPYMSAKTTETTNQSSSELGKCENQYLQFTQKGKEFITNLNKIFSNQAIRDMFIQEGNVDLVKSLPKPVKPDINKTKEEDVNKYNYLYKLEHETEEMLNALGTVIKTVYNNNDEVKEFLNKIYISESRIPDKYELEKQYLQEVEKDFTTTEQSGVFGKSGKKDGFSRDEFIIQSMHDYVETAYESGNILIHYMPEDTQTYSSEKLSNVDRLKKERDRLENIINEVFTIYSNKLFGVGLATMRLEPKQEKFDNLKTKYRNEHDKFQQDQHNEGIKQDLSDKVEKLKTAKAYTDVANKRLANMNYLAERAKNILDECMKTWHIDNVRIVESLDKEYFTQIADRLRSLKEENDKISKKLEIFHEEEKKCLPEMQKSLTAKKS